MKIIIGFVTLSALVSLGALACGDTRPPKPPQGPPPTELNHKPPTSDPLAGTRFKVLVDLFERSTTPLSPEAVPHFDSLKKKMSLLCVNVSRDNPDRFDESRRLARLHPPSVNAGPLFPSENKDKIWEFQAGGDPSTWMSEDAFATQLWNVLSLEAKADRTTIKNRDDLTELRQSGDFISYRRDRGSTGEWDAYGYCYTADQQPLQSLK